MNERRQLPRWKISKEAKVWMPQTEGFSHCTVEDMHLKGMCVSFDKPLVQQKIMKMSFGIVDNFDLISIEADMPWMEETQGRYVYGLSFNKIDDQNKDRMYQYISMHCYDQFRKNWWA